MKSKFLYDYIICQIERGLIILLITSKKWWMRLCRMLMLSGRNEESLEKSVIGFINSYIDNPVKYSYSDSPMGCSYTVIKLNN